MCQRFIVVFECDSTAQDGFCFVEVFQPFEYCSKSIMSISKVRILLNSGTSKRQGLFVSSLVSQQYSQVVVSPPRIWIEAHNVPPERFVICPDLLMVQRTHRQQRKYKHHTSIPNAFLPQARQAICTISGRTDDDGHDPNTGEILKAVGDKSISHIAIIDETQHRRQRDRKEQRPSQRSFPQLQPETPQSGPHHDSSNKIPPSQQVGGMDVPTRVDNSQIGRPHQLPRVKPQGAGGNKRPFG